MTFTEAFFLLILYIYVGMLIIMVRALRRHQQKNLKPPSCQKPNWYIEKKMGAFE